MKIRVEVTLELPVDPSPAQIQEWLDWSLDGGIYPDDSNPLSGLDLGNVDASALSWSRIDARPGS